jgi:DNA invertase Pin-like site-specific DNA recombinase
VTATLIGYARCSTDKQDLTANRNRLLELGVAEDRIYLDRGLTDTNRARPGLDQALAAVRTGDTFVVPKLDRLARSVPDAGTSATPSPPRGIRLSLGGTIYDPAGPDGAGDHTIPDVAELFSVSRATVYRVLDRARAQRWPAPPRPW